MSLNYGCNQPHGFMNRIVYACYITRTLNFEGTFHGRENLQRICFDGEEVYIVPTKFVGNMAICCWRKSSNPEYYEIYS